MKSKILPGVVAALAVAMAPTANASSKPTGSHWGPDGGRGCGFATVNTDPANPQSTHYEGEADCEVMWMFRRPPPTDVVVASSSARVKLQTCPHHHPQGPGYGDACTFNRVLWSCTLTGPAPNVVVGACPVAYDRSPFQALYFCAEYYWTETPPTTNYAYMPDADPVTPGKQCPLV